MDKKIGKLVSNVGKNAKDLFDKSKDIAMNVADQNADGKFDLEDISVITNTVGSAMKKRAKALKETTDEKARKIELKNLNPIFAENLNTAEFIMPKFIRIADRDKKRAESGVCQGAIGFGSNIKNLYVVNIFKDSIDAYGLRFYPDCESEFYYVDPSDRNCYIALNEYFNYLKIARISELKRIAQDLGAKYFRVTYKEEKASFSEKKANVKMNVKPISSAESAQNHSEKKYSTVDIAAEMDFPGHKPIKPTLKYLRNDPSIKGLIDMRMNEQSPLLHEKFTLKLSSSSGLKESEAVKIDAVLKGMKCSGNVSVASEVQAESRKYLDYEIEF